MWLALPISAWEYWQVWDQLPTRMAVHFDANWQPNGYTSREGALELGLGNHGGHAGDVHAGNADRPCAEANCRVAALLIAYVVRGLLLVRESFAS